MLPEQSDGRGTCVACGRQTILHWTTREFCVFLCTPCFSSLGEDAASALVVLVHVIGAT